MALTRQQKKEILDDFKKKIEKQKIIIFVDLKGLKVKDLSNLRSKLKKTDSQIKVSKKTLLSLALKERGIEFDKKKLEGEIASVFGFKDEILPPKIVWQFSQENPNLKILGGFLENRFVEADKIIELAKLPTEEELLARLVGSISAPISNFINVLQANTKGLIFALSAIKK